METRADDVTISLIEALVDGGLTSLLLGLGAVTKSCEGL
jgi:hypothetical protein